MWSEAGASNEGELLKEESLPSVLRKGDVTVLNVLVFFVWNWMKIWEKNWGGGGGIIYIGKDL